MVSPDEPRGETTEPTRGPGPEVPTSDAASSGTGAVSPSRPRSSAKFAGGAPPPTAPSNDVPAPPLPAAPPAPAEVASFQVTTVDRQTASRPAGPPPARRRAPTPAPAAPPAAAPAPTPAPAPVPAPTEPVSVAPAPVVAAEAADADSGDSPARRPRRRRGRGGRGGAGRETEPAGEAGIDHDEPEPAPVAAELARPVPAPVEPAPDAEAEQPPGRGRGRSRRRGARGAEAEPVAAQAVQLPSEPKAPVAPATAAEADGDTDGDTDGDDDDDAAGGSSRTRARRRRRAAARERVRAAQQLDPAAPAPSDNGVSASPAPAPAARTAPPPPVPPPPVLDVAPTPAATPAAAAAEPVAPAAERGPDEARGRRRGRGGPGRERGERGERRAPAASAASAVGASADTGEATAEAPSSPAVSTRLAAGRQGRQGRRRRSTGLTEEQKLAMREHGPEKRMLVTEGEERTQIGVVEGRSLVEHYVTRKAGRSQVGNIYLGRVQNVLPGMEAAFVDIGKGRNAVLYAGEVTYNEEDLEGEPPRIERALKPGQPVLVQVTKDPIGSKGARLTTALSLAGRYLVLAPNGNTFGISRRLPDAERSRLRDILKEVRPKGLGLIVRTAAEGASAEDLRADLTRLQARWEQVERKAAKASAPSLIYAEPELVVRVIRDIFSPDFVELVVDAPELHERVNDYLTEVAPDLLPKLRRHDGRLPLFEQYRVVEQIHKALERKVWLPSGGSIVIDRTEAMTVVDVNTGKFVGRTNSSLEETVVANNLEAAEEIVRQLRLRDIGGIVIIDFIDMLFERNQQAVIDRLKAALARDKTKSQVMDISPLGLVQMTRKRVSGGLLESFSEPCPTCEGRGIVITHEL
jgi:ribonuclease E